MGEPFRAHMRDEITFATWFAQADRNHDSILTPDEMQADAERFFGRLDTNRDGQIDPDELIRYEWEVAPEIQLGTRRMRAPGEPPPPKPARRRGGGFADYEAGPQGAARYALLNIPEPVAAADLNFDRAISLSEFRQAAAARFALLDRGHAGRVSLAELEAMLPKAGEQPKHKANELDTRIGNPLPPGN